MNVRARTTGEGSGGAWSPVIPIRVQSISDLFHPLDPSPLRTRSLSSEVAAYLSERLEAMEKGAQASIQVWTDAEGVRRADDVCAAVRGHLLHEASRHESVRRRIVAMGRRRMLGGALFALALVALAQALAEVSELRSVQTVANGISIIVWVVMWRPVETLVYDWREPAILRDMFMRHADSAVTVVEIPETHARSARLEKD